MTNYVKRTEKMLKAAAWASQSVSFFITTKPIIETVKKLAIEGVAERLENAQAGINARAKHNYRRATLGREATAALEAQEQQIQPGGMGG